MQLIDAYRRRGSLGNVSLTIESPTFLMTFYAAWYKPMILHICSYDINPVLPISFKC